MNITDYIKDFHQTFREKIFNEVDSLMFCQLFYARWEDQLKSEGIDWINPGYTVKDFNKLEFNHLMYCDGIADEENLEFNLLASANRRFRDLKVKNIVAETSAEDKIQFAAVSFEIDDLTDYVCFRGTDGTMTGWKEDLEMSFAGIVPSQREAVKYLERFYGPGSEGEKKRIYVGGHSKGGNLAVFSSLMCDPSIHPRILEVFSHDGPGFKEEVFAKLRESQNKAHLKISKTVPQTSIIGLLMQTDGNAQVVKSDAWGIMQHSTLSWQIENGTFVHLEKLSDTGKYMDRTLHEWLEHCPDESREKFTNALFNALVDNDITSIPDFKTLKPSKILAIKKSFDDQDEETKEALDLMFKSLMKVAWEQLVTQH